MIDIVADLHLHSPYSRAVSSQMTLANITSVAKQKGLDILATGDWTYPLWFDELRSQLVENEEGLYQLKNNNENVKDTPRFLLSTEIATIFRQAGKGRRIHQLIFVPSFETAAKVSRELVKRGCNLSSDGRPIIGLSSHDLLELILTIDERSLLIPAHVWTPWFGIYGQMSGFDSLTQAFEELSPYVYGIETGLSSDPEMNWQIRELTTRSILSFSDAHSLPKMGREATVFRLESLSFENIRKAIMAPSQHPSVIANEIKQSDLKKIATSQAPRNDDSNHVLYTIEFYPEEGKYHYSGHRNCRVIMTPEQQRSTGGICPVCKRKVTDGVMRRVQELSSEKSRGLGNPDTHGILWIEDPMHRRSPFVKLVPLMEVITEAVSSSVSSKKTKLVFETLCTHLTSELFVLLQAEIADIEKIALLGTTAANAKRVAEGIRKVREAQIVIQPGYDGVYGVVKIWPEGKDVDKDTDEAEKSQIKFGF